MTSPNTPDVSSDDTTAGGAKPPRRRATRATKAAAPVAAAAPDETAGAAPTTPDEPAPAVPEAGTATAEPATSEQPAPRRRATRGRKAPVPDEPVTSPSGERGAGSAAPVPPAGPSDGPGAPAVEEEADELPEEVVVEDVVDELAAQEAAAQQAAVTAAEPAAASPRLATTALLFQAPDLSQARPRRRRATATAGSPEQISQAARRAEAEAAAEAVVQVDEPVDALTGTAAEAVDELTGTAAEAVAAAEIEQGAPSRSSRRRRGGRGRGSRDEVAVDAVDEVVVPEPVEAEEPTDEDEVAEEDDGDLSAPRRRRRRGGRGRRSRNGTPAADAEEADAEESDADSEPEDEDAAGEAESGTTRRRRRRRRGSRPDGGEPEPRRRDEVTALRGSTRLEAKRQRRREGRDAGRRRQIITEAEFLARRESVDRIMAVRERGGRTQIAVLEDGVLVEHYVSDQAAASMVGNVYLGRVQNVLPSMEAAFVDVGKGRNAVLYAGEVNWDAAGLEGGQPRRIEQALKSGDSVLVQVTKDPIGHKGARLTSQVTLAGRYLVLVPGGGMTGISRKLPDTERNRLKKILRDIVPESAGVIVRTAAEGASEDELRADIARLTGQWEAIEAKAARGNAPALLQGEPDMAIRVVRDIFNDDFSSLVVQGDEAWETISSYVGELAPDLAARVTKWTQNIDVFTVHRVDEQLAKGMDRKVWLPSGGSLVIDRTEAMTVIDVNTGKFTGAGGTLEETVTRNNLEAAEEIVRQLRLRDIGGIIVIDFIDMVLESNRDLVLRRLVECLGRDRTKHQVAEVTSLGLVQMTRKRVGQGLVEAFSETCEHCHGRGFIVHTEPVERNGRPDAGGGNAGAPAESAGKRSRRKRTAEPSAAPAAAVPVLPEAREAVKATLATIAAAAAHAHQHEHDDEPHPGQPEAASDQPAVAADEVAALDEVHDHTAEPSTEPAAAHAPVIDVLAAFADRVPLGRAPHEPDAAALAGLAGLRLPGTADESPVDEAPAQPPVDGEAEPLVEPGGTDEPALELELVDPAVFDLPDDAEPAAEDASDDAGPADRPTDG